MRTAILRIPTTVMLGLLAIIMPVHAGAPAGHYTISSGTVYDTKTKLTWQQAASSTTYTWDGAVTLCVSPWRLPTIKELITLFDVTQATPRIDSVAFPSTPAEAFWTSTLSATDSTRAWLAHFGGTTGDMSKAFKAYVRCVR